jgi:hypothetical protein
MKSDSYSRYLRSDMYKEFLGGTKKKVQALMPFKLIDTFHPKLIKKEWS